MKTLRQAEPISLGLPLFGINLYSAMYVSRLVGRVLMAEVPMPALFHDYLHALTELAQCENQNPHYAVLSWLYSLQWGMASTFALCRHGEPVDPEMTYRYREQKDLSHR